MTNELEKQFFNTFNIEPIGCNDNKNCTGALDCTQCPNAKYPQITDHKLLGLICIDNQENIYKCRPPVDNVKDLKTYILEEFIHLKEVGLLKRAHQVRTLFEEG